MPRPAHELSFWRLQLAGWAMYAAALIATFLPMFPAEGSVLRLIENKSVRALIGLGLSSVLRLGYRRIVSGAPFGVQAAAALAGSALLGTAWALLGDLYGALRSVHFDWPSAHARLPRTALDYAVTLLGWSALYFGLTHARESRAARERALRADALAHEARLASLRHQLQPHFLFNALTSIRALIEEEPARARRVVTEVAEFLRFSLLKGSGASVPLGDELTMVRSYLAIETVRFEEKLQVEVHLQPGVEACRVPAFLLQPLVDNAVKHGMASGVLPLRITLRAEAHDGTLRLEVANTGCWAPVSAGQRPEGTGTGLRNVSARLAALYPGQGRLTHAVADGWVRVRVELPAPSLSLTPPEEAHARAPGG